MLLRSYGVLREKIKILDFDKKCLAGIRKTWGEVLKDFMLTFNLHVNGQCLKK